MPKRADSSWLVFHLLFWALLYAAFAMDLEGARNCVLFVVWVCAGVSFLFYGSDVAKLAESPRPTAAKRLMGHALAWSTLATLIWNGYQVTAVAWLVLMFNTATTRDRVKKYRAEADRTPD